MLRPRHIGLIGLLVLLLAVVFVVKPVASGGGSGSSIEGQNNGVQVVSTISAINADGTTIIGSDEGLGVYGLEVNLAAFPTPTPQGLTSILSVDNTTSGFDINMSGATDQLRFQRTNTAEFDARTQTTGIGTLYIPNLNGTIDDVVAEDVAQTLTNKTIDGDDNTFVDVKPDQFDNLDSPADEECATYESNQIEWQPCGAGGNTLFGQRREADGVVQSHYMVGCITSCTVGLGSTTAGIAENALIAIPFFNANPSATIDTIRFEVTTAGAATRAARVGVYTDDGDLHPGNLLVDAGTVLVDTTGTKTITFTSTAMTQNTWYWVVLATDSASMQMRTISASAPLQSSFNHTLGVPNNQLNRFNWAWQASFTCGAACVNSLPGTYPTTGQTIMNNVSHGSPVAIFIEVD